MSLQVAQRNNSTQVSKPLPNVTSIKQHQKVSLTNTSCRFKDFSDLQVKVTRETIENIRKITNVLNQDIVTSSSKDNKTHKMFVNIECLNKKPYKPGHRSIEDLPESVQKNFDLKKYEIHFATPHAMAEITTVTLQGAKEEFPSLEDLQKEVSHLKLKPHEDKLYGLIVNGIKFAFYPPTKDQQKLATFDNLNLKELLIKMSALEDINFNESNLISTCRILSRQALKLTREYADQALKSFPEAFEPQAKVSWTLSKVEAVAKAQI